MDKDLESAVLYLRYEDSSMDKQLPDQLSVLLLSSYGHRRVLISSSYFRNPIFGSPLKLDKNCLITKYYREISIKQEYLTLLPPLSEGPNALHLLEYLTESSSNENKLLRIRPGEDMVVKGNTENLLASLRWLGYKEHLDEFMQSILKKIPESENYIPAQHKTSQHTENIEDLLKDSEFKEVVEDINEITKDAINSLGPWIRNLYSKKEFTEMVSFLLFEEAIFYNKSDSKPYYPDYNFFAAMVSDFSIVFREELNKVNFIDPSFLVNPLYENLMRAINKQ